MIDLLVEIRQHAEQLDSFGATPRVLVLAANEIERLRGLLSLARETEEVLQARIEELETRERPRWRNGAQAAFYNNGDGW